MNKLLTVSVAAYNVEKYINQCLSTFANHIFDDRLEVLIIDDGGNDGTLQIAQNYERLYPDIFKAVHKENGGWGSTVNYGIEHASGKYFKQLDGDDYYNPEYFSKFLEVLSDMETDIIYTPFDVFEDGKDDFVYHEQEKAFALYKVYDLEDIERFALRMHTLTFKTSVLRENKVRLLENCFYTDIELVVKAIYGARTIVFSDIPVYCYRVGRSEQSVSFSSMIKHYMEHEKVLFEIINSYNTHKNNKKNDYIAYRISQMVDVNYEILVHMRPNKKNKRLLRRFDEKLLADKKFYNVKNKKILFLRKTNFITYLPILIYAHLKKNQTKQVY